RLLPCSLTARFRGALSTDHLINEPLRDFHFCCGSEIDLVNPRVHRGEFFRLSHRLHHLLTGPSLGSRSNTRAFYLNTSRTLPRSSWRNSHAVRCEFSRFDRSRRGKNAHLVLSHARRVSPYTPEAKAIVARAIALRAFQELCRHAARFALICA